MTHGQTWPGILLACLGLSVPAVRAESNSTALRSFEMGSGAGGQGDDSTQPGNQPRSDQPIDAISWTLSLDYRYPLTGDYRSVYMGRMMLEAATAGHHALGFSVAAGGVHLKSGSPAASIAHDPAILEAAAHYRLYFTVQEAVFRPYGTFMLGMNSLYWDYREEVLTGGDTVSWDAALGYDAYAGVGLLVNVTESFQLFGEMGYGGIGYLDTTANELKNEFFDSFGYVAIKGGLGWRF